MCYEGVVLNLEDLEHISCPKYRSISNLIGQSQIKYDHANKKLYINLKLRKRAFIKCVLFIYFNRK